MSEMSGFFPDVSGDRSYTADFLAKWVASIIGNGVYDGELAVTADGSAMSVTLPAGRVWINGYHYRNDAALTLPIANADGVLNRKDTVVLRWDVNARSITAQVLEGTPASTATAPAIVRTSEQYDLKLAEVSIPAGTTAITRALITDTRLDKSVCGIVTGVVDQVDTTTFYNQIAADLAAFKATNEAGFTAWVQGLQSVLDESTAGNLLNLINTHKADETVHMTTLACTKSGTVYALTGLTATSGAAQVTFKVPTAYVAGDTVTIDGTAYTLKTTDATALAPGAWAIGATITGTVDVDAKTLTVNPSAPVGSVPVTRKVNGKALSSDIQLATGDITNCVDATRVPTFSGGSGGVEGGEIHLLAAPSSGGYDVALDISTRKFRIFEQGGGANGAYIDMSALSAGVGSRLLTNTDFAAAGATATVRPIVILGKTDSIPTGLADNTVVLRKQS